MHKNIETVLAAWWIDKPCKQATCSTNGRTVFSYALPIGRVSGKPGTANNIRTVTVRSSGPSHTTRMQIRAVRSFVQKKGGRLVETAEISFPLTHPCRFGLAKTS